MPYYEDSGGRATRESEWRTVVFRMEARTCREVE
jgi:hypothetical protein